MILQVSHLTRYYYSQKVHLSPHRLYLRPRETPRHKLRRFTSDFAPPARMVTTLDAADNVLAWCYWNDAVTAVNLSTEFEIETLDANPFDFVVRPDAAGYPFKYDADERTALAAFLWLPASETAERLKRWLAEAIPQPPQETVAYLDAVNNAVRRAVEYTRREESGILEPLATLDQGKGSCRDSATLLIAVLRTMGLAARFVSGYLYEPPPDAGTPAVPTAMHAWTEVFIPGAGWKGLDSTRGIFCNDAFVPVAHAAQGATVSPVQGSYYGPPSTTAELQADITVQRVDV